MTEKVYKNNRDKKGRFVSGNKEGGRPKGSRNKLGEAFLDKLYEDFQEHGVEAIQEVRTTKPDAYLKVIAQVLPKQIDANLKPSDELTDLSESIHATVNFLSRFAIEAGSEEDITRPLPN